MSATPVEGRFGSSIKEDVRRHYERAAVDRDKWYRRNLHYHSYLERTLAEIIPAGSSVLEIGCGSGNLLASLRPTRGHGLDPLPGHGRCRT